MADEKKKKSHDLGQITVCRVLTEGDGAGAWVPLEVPGLKSTADAGKWLRTSADDGRYAVVRLVGIVTVKTVTTTRRVVE